MSDDRPNILAICLDQINPDWFSLHGHPLVRTPHMDSIGGAGMTFRRAHSPCPTCIPARQTIMTGLDPWGINMFANKGGQPLPEGKATLAGLLSDAGYHTHAVGKMHNYPERDRMGFHDIETDEEYRKNTDGTLHDYEQYLQDVGLAHRMTSHGGPNQYGWRLDSILHHSPWVLIAPAALERRDKDKPFFLYTSFRQPHPHLRYSQLLGNVSRKNTMPVYGDWCEDKMPDHWKRLHLKHRTNYGGIMPTRSPIISALMPR